MLFQKGGVFFKEMLDQPKMWKSVLKKLHSERKAWVSWFKEMKFGQVVCLGVGEQHGIAHIVSAVMQWICSFTPVTMHPSEYLFLRRPPYDVRITTLVLVFSREGEEQDLLWALERLKKWHPKCQVLHIGLSSGPLEGHVNKMFHFPSLKEEGVQTSRSVTCGLMVGLGMASLISGKDGFFKELVKACDNVDFKHFQSNIQQCATIRPEPKLYSFLGNNLYYGVAYYAANKLQTVAGVAANAHHGLAFRHGYLGGLTPSDCIVQFLSDSLRDAELRVLIRMAKEKPTRILFGEKLDEKTKLHADKSFNYCTPVSEVTRCLYACLASQLFSFYSALGRGKDPDKVKLEEAYFELPGNPGV